MNRISRLFGKKEESPPLEDSEPVDANTGFGLKFILNSGEERLFTALPISIGRQASNDLVLEDETVSATHAVVYFDSRIQKICIQDQDSLNGLWVDGLPTRQNILQDGVEIRVGNMVLTFRDTGYLPSA